MPDQNHYRFPDEMSIAWSRPPQSPTFAESGYPLRTRLIERLNESVSVSASITV